MNESSTEMVLDGVRSPVDRVAARVLKVGVSYSPDKVINNADQGTPHELRNPLGIPREHRGLIGAKFGRFTVLGMSFQSTSKGALWSVRCACGTYTLRYARAIRNTENYGDCCDACRHLQYLKRNEVWRRTGKDVDLRCL